jgi:RNA polymerase sigma factor (TIGR02999 family)
MVIPIAVVYSVADLATFQRQATLARPRGAFMNRSSMDVTLLLRELSRGNQDALAELIPAVYDELRRLAGYYLHQERSDHTLQATALVHEAYLRLVDQRRVDWKNRSHFFGVAAHLMRRVLLMHAREHRALKRGGAAQKISLDETAIYSQAQADDLVFLDELLNQLERLDLQQERIVEMRFFAGLSVEETADVLGISTATVKRDWAMAKGWLAREMGQAAHRKTS